MPTFSSEGEEKSDTGAENGWWIPPPPHVSRFKWITEFYLNNLIFFFFFSLSSLSLSCDDWHLNPQSTFNVCLQSIMDVYFVYCWFAKSMFCVTDNVVYSSVRLCSSLPPRCLIRTFVCAVISVFSCQVSSLSACLFGFLFGFVFPPLCKTSIRWTRLQWFVF